MLMLKKNFIQNINQKKKFFKSTIKTLKKKIIFKKKKYNILKKKKLNVIYKNFSLENHSLLYKLSRKIVKKKLLLQKFEILVKLKMKFNKLNFIKTNHIYIYLIQFLNNPLKILNKSIIARPKKVLVRFCLNITVHSNNIFINLAKYVKRIFKTVKYWSAGFFDFICSKTKLKFAISVILKEVKIKIKKLKIYIIKINAPKYLNKYIFKQLARLFYKSKFLIYSSFKIFNGCRSSKKRRKKRLKFRFFR